MATQFQRQTAILCNLLDIKSGEWVQNEGLEPSGIKCVRGMVSRANVLAVVVDKPTEQTLLVEDGTARLTLRTFDPMPYLEQVSAGDIVQIIGKPREYNNERYVVLELCRKVSSGWVEYRKKELEFFSGNTLVEFQQPKAPEPTPIGEVAPETVEVPADTKNPFEQIIEVIRTLDEGEGVSIDDILEKVENGDTEKFIKTLIEEGEIFENKPGRVKVLE